MTNSGVSLEARVQRMFLAQGIFAERSLYPSADANHKLLATDIDVLASEYSSGFHLTRRHAECKSGKRVSTLDRVLWLNGVRSLLGADASYLVLASFDEDAADFARNLGVDVLTIKQLETWEKSLGIPKDKWPARSEFMFLDPIKTQLNNFGKKQDSSEKDRKIRESVQFVEIDSWRLFGYGQLNRLLRLLKELSDECRTAPPRGIGIIASRYAASALLVRLSQYMMAICHDISRVPVSDSRAYLQSRLLFGDQDSVRARALVQTTVDWMSTGLREQGVSVPLELDSKRLFEPPDYSEGLFSLIQKLLDSPFEARYLPIAMEAEQFGKADDAEDFPRLRSAWNTGRHLAALVKAFAIASLKVESSHLTPLRAGPASEPRVGKIGGAETAGNTPDQAKFYLRGS